MKRIASLLAAIAALCATPAGAADGKALYAANCAACHGPSGGGIAGQGPALKSSWFVTEGDVEAIGTLIASGRAVADKMFANIPAPMPPVELPAADRAAIAKFVKEDLQR
jgi:mono/diheme cytochrome c family protein